MWKSKIYLILFDPLLSQLTREQLITLNLLGALSTSKSCSSASASSRAVPAALILELRPQESERCQRRWSGRVAGRKARVFIHLGEPNAPEHLRTIASDELQRLDDSCVDLCAIGCWRTTLRLAHPTGFAQKIKLLKISLIWNNVLTARSGVKNFNYDLKSRQTVNEFCRNRETDRQTEK